MESTSDLRQCPTRIDGAHVLFAHKLSERQCQDRQRGQYHKCFTCAFNNAYVSVNGLPSAAEQEQGAGQTEVRRVSVG